MSDDHLNVVPIGKPSDVSSPILRDRAALAARPNARQHVARVRDQEAGYLSFDDWPDQARGVIYEVFVLAQYRSRGVGSTLLRFAEDLARRAGYSRVWLYPSPIDDGISKARLVEGYERSGYGFRPNSHVRWRRCLRAR